MVLWSSSDIFQANLYDLLSDIKGVKTYIVNIIVLGKVSFYQHVYQLIVVFARLRTKLLKANDPKWSFGLNSITYLCYIIPREGLKPYPKKLQGIMEIGQPTTITEARALIGMVQYYSDMWTSNSHVLSPLK